MFPALHTNKRYCSEEEVEEGNDRMFDSPGVADRSCGLEAVKGVLRQPGPSCLVRHGAVVGVVYRSQVTGSRSPGTYISCTIKSIIIIVHRCQITMLFVKVVRANVPRL